MSFEELIKKACERNEQVNGYIDGDFKLRNNWRLRPILNVLPDNPSIKEVQKKPIALQ